MGVRCGEAVKSWAEMAGRGARPVGEGRRSQRVPSISTAVCGKAVTGRS
jgi:hypothetical protein